MRHMVKLSFQKTIKYINRFNMQIFLVKGNADKKIMEFTKYK